MSIDDVRPSRLSRPGCEVAYNTRASTSGRWVVLLHGAGMDGHMFDAQLPALPDDVGIVCWDARGHGASTLDGPFRYTDMLDDLVALVELLDPVDLTLVGQSMGGNLAQSYVAAHPDGVSRLVLIDCSDNHGPLAWLQRLALRSTPLVMRAYPCRALVDQSARACGTRPATIAYAADRLRRTGRERFIEVMRFWTDALTPDPPYRLPVPTLAIVGAEDRSGNIAAAMAALAARDPQVRLETVPSAAHNANMDQPDLVNELLADFLGS